jgi:hypothetical protein
MDSRLDNPFCKESFATYRDWEDTLLRFFVAEANHPRLSDWEELALSADPLCLAYSALLLSCLVQSKPKVSKSSAVLLDVCQKLGGKTDHDLVDYNAWIQTNWLNVSRIANRLKAELAHQ